MIGKSPLKVKGRYYKVAVRPALLYRSECWAVKHNHVKKMAVAEMRMLRWMCGITRRDRIRNEEIRVKVGIAPIEDKMREYEKNREEEKKNMLDEIDRLKNEGINADKEQEYLIKSNDELNNKLRETTSNMDLLRATALMSTVPKMKSLLKNKKKKKGY